MPLDATSGVFHLMIGSQSASRSRLCIEIIVGITVHSYGKLRFLYLDASQLMHSVVNVAYAPVLQFRFRNFAASRVTKRAISGVNAIMCTCCG
jgi:hypothetical protein